MGNKLGNNFFVYPDNIVDMYRSCTPKNPDVFIFNVHRPCTPIVYPSEKSSHATEMPYFKGSGGSITLAMRFEEPTSPGEHIVHIDGANERSVSPVGCPAKQEASRVC